MIQTVTGTISKNEDTGSVLMHEHISCASLSYEKAFGTKWLDKNALKLLAVDTLKQTKTKYGLGLMVDGTPIDLGRDAAFLKEVSELSGVKIVASTGFYYLQSVEAVNNSASDLAQWLIYECKNGISGTDVKPGILKCATGEQRITADNRKKLSAMGIVQRETGLPLYIHCEHNGDIARRQIEILLENGADIGKIIIGHTAIRPDTEYLKGILDLGCYICMDQSHCYKSKTFAIAQTLVELCKMGYGEKILVANDYCIHSDFGTWDRNGLNLTAEQHTEGLGYIFDKIYCEYISAGGSDEAWNNMLCQNSVAILDI